MKYKVGDKVKIKTWEQMRIEMGLSCKGVINLFYHHADWYPEMETGFRRDNPKRIVEITEVCSFYYQTEPLTFSWVDDMIDYKLGDEVSNRWEILDL